MDVRTRISQDLLLHWTTTEGQRDEVEHRLKDNEGATPSEGQGVQGAEEENSGEKRRGEQRWKRRGEQR